MICTNCGKKVPDTAKVCGYCGHRLKNDNYAIPAPFPAQVASTPVLVKPKVPGWMWAVIAVLALLVVMALGSTILLAKKRAGVATPLPVSVASTPKGMEPIINPDIPTDNQEAGSVNPATPEPVLPDNKIIVEPVDKGDTTASLASLGTKTGTNTWLLNIAATTPAKMNWGWCAVTQAILDQNLKNMQVTFYVDDLDVTDSVGQSTVEATDAQTSTVYYCHNYHGVIRSWTAGKHIIIHKMIFLQKINDGWEDAEGSRTRTFEVNVAP